MRNADITAGVVATNLVAPSAVTSTAAIASVDLGQYIGKVLLVLTARNTAGTNPTLALKVQNSAAADTGQADISGKAFTGLTTTNVNGVQTMELDTAAMTLGKYVNIHGTIGGTDNPAYVVSVVVIGRKQVQ
jgi:hypothetical protein